MNNLYDNAKIAREAQSAITEQAAFLVKRLQRHGAPERRLGALPYFISNATGVLTGPGPNDINAINFKVSESQSPHDIVLVCTYDVLNNKFVVKDMTRNLEFDKVIGLLMAVQTHMRELAASITDVKETP